MSFFSLNLRPIFRILAVVATCFWLSMVVAYIADRSTDRPKPTVSASKTTATELIQPAEQRHGFRALLSQDERLFGRGLRYEGFDAINVVGESDKVLLMGFRTNFMSDFRRAFDKRIGRQEKPAPDRSFMATAVLRSLTLELRSRGATDVDKIVGTIAEHVSRLEREEDSTGFYREKPAIKTWKDEEGFWRLADVHEEKEIEDLRQALQERPLDPADYQQALERIPPAYAAYFRSLNKDQAKALAEVETLLGLSWRERKPLEAIARYRRARLTMESTKWADVSDGEAKTKLARIRADFTEAARLAAEGSLDPAELSDNGRYWIAYTRSMIMPFERLVRLGEADLPGAFSTYLGMPERMDSNSVNACFRLVTNLCRQKAFDHCAQDPDLRLLVSMYLTANGDVSNGVCLTDQEQKDYSVLWLEALARAQKTAALDPRHIALLQYRVGRWRDCMETLKFASSDDPLARLLALRCCLRLTGEVRDAYEVTGPRDGFHEEPNYARCGPEKFAAILSYKGTPPPELPTYDFSTYIDITNNKQLRTQLTGERAILALTLGNYRQALLDFESCGMWDVVQYIAECLMSLDELRNFIDGRRYEHRRSPIMKNAWGKEIGDVDTMLASRLFRMGREDEALTYVRPQLFGQASLYLVLRKLATNPDIDARVRADAYWRASLLVPALSTQLLEYPFSPWLFRNNDRKTFSIHISYDSLPHHRLELGEYAERHKKHPLLSAAEDERSRISRWLASCHDMITDPKDKPDYIQFALAVEAGRLLPADDPAGATILQYAGNILKYKDPEGAVSAFRLLARKYAATPYGEFAANHSWFAKEYPTPPENIVTKPSEQVKAEDMVFDTKR